MISQIKRLFSNKVKQRVKRLICIKFFKTLYINFTVLPFWQAIQLPIIVLGKLRIVSLRGKVRFDCPIRFGLVVLGADVDAMPITFVPTQINIQGLLSISGNVIVNKGASLVVWENGEMSLGNDVMICSGCLVKAVNRVKIGNHVMISSGCFIMDSSIHCIYNTETLDVKSSEGQITIGNNVWLNMYTDIVKWGGVPDGCVTARYTFVNKPANDLSINILSIIRTFR